MKSITLSADEHLIEAAQARAHAEHTTLEEQFQRWLEDYSHQQDRLKEYDEVIAKLKGKLKVGRKLTRDEMNER